jgi:hypothetical protein
MKSVSLELKYKNTELPIQIITLSNSYYVYVGTNKLNFDNLTIGMYVCESNENKLDFNKVNTNKSEMNKDNNKNDEKTLNDTSNAGFSCSSSILDDINSFYAKQICERLSYKLGCPIYLSFNIPDEFVDLEMKIKLETGIYNYIKSL